MKRITTVILAVAFMIAGVSVAFMENNRKSSNSITAAPVPPTTLQWNVNGKLPLDLQLDLDKRLSHETPTIQHDTVYVDKIKWKTRYKISSDRTTARKEGFHIAAVTPDSMPNGPSIISTPIREEQLGDTASHSKWPAIQLTVDGVIVYQSEDEIHSTGESQ